jgi:hypothetical protein
MSSGFYLITNGLEEIEFEFWLEKSPVRRYLFSGRKFVSNSAIKFS